MTLTVLVVGATGATGKHLVHQLLQKKHNVRAIVRSKERLLSLLGEIEPDPQIASGLDTIEASVLDLTQDELEKAVQGCDAVVSCLGHNLTFKGLFFPPRKLVTEAVKRLCRAIESTNQVSGNQQEPTKLLLMGSDGVASPAGGDDQRSLSERATLTLLRYLIPPHKDNELAAAYISGVKSPGIEWVVVRPTDLINGDATKYSIFAKPQKSLFSGSKGGLATRATVAQFMTDLIVSDGLWKEWKGSMPVVHDDLDGNVVSK